MPTLRDLLSGLSNEELEALEQEFIKAQASDGEIASEQGRGLLRANMPSRIGKGVLAGIQAGGQSIVSDVRQMAGFKADTTEWHPRTREEALEFEKAKNAGAIDEFLAKKKLESQLEIDKINQLIGNSGQTESSGSRFRVKGADVGGMNLERIPTEEEKQQAIQQKVDEAQALESKKGLPIETGGKLAMVKQAKSDIQEVRQMLFPDGTPKSFSRGRAFVSNLPGSRAPILGAVIPQAMPFNEMGQKIYSRLQNAVAAKLRVETGAQANPSEVENILARFGVTSASDANAAFDALQRLENFMDETISITDPKGKFNKSTSHQSENNDPLGIR